MVTGPVDLYTLDGKFVRRCLLGPCQARETVKDMHPGIGGTRLSHDGSELELWFGRSKVYTYQLRPVLDAVVVELPVWQEPAGLDRAREGA
jgi:hypothetical protein